MEAVGTVDALNAMLQTREKLQIVYFTASWCVPCKRIAPVLQQCAADNDSQVLKVDIDTFDGAYLTEQAVASVPTFIMYKANVKLARVNGAASDALNETVQKYAHWKPRIAHDA